jgi:hypothetical protein
MCVEPNHVKYARYAVSLYQEKGQDFSEEVGSHFVHACLRGNSPDVAAEVMAKYKNRIGAWVTLKPLLALTEKLCEANKFELLVNMLTVVSTKGARSSKETFEKVLHSLPRGESASTEGYDALHAKVIEAATKMISKEDVDALIQQFPAPTPASVPSEVEVEVADSTK